MFPSRLTIVSLIKQHLHNIMQLLEDPTATMTDMQRAVADILETESLHLIDMFIYELRKHGIEDPSKLEKAYSGCFPSVQAFTENYLEEFWSETLDVMPTFLITAIDYDAVWYQRLQHDYTEIYFDYEYYFFNRNV